MCAACCPIYNIFINRRALQYYDNFDYHICIIGQVSAGKSTIDNAFYDEEFIKPKFNKKKPTDTNYNILLCIDDVNSRINYYKKGIKYEKLIIPNKKTY